MKKSAAQKARKPKPRVLHQPASISAAADAKGVFLHTDDSWSRAYWDSSDLHCVERELFAKGP
jgi:hypothetical protein